jgi:hypothetical protein
LTFLEEFTERPQQRIFVFGVQPSKLVSFPSTQAAQKDAKDVGIDINMFLF